MEVITNSVRKPTLNGENYLEELKELAEALPQPRILYSATILLDNGEFWGELSLAHNEFEIVMEKQEEPKGRRRYTWTYEDIEQVLVSESSEFKLSVVLENKVSNGDRALEIDFEYSSVRDKFAFRLKTLARLFKRRSPKVTDEHPLDKYHETMEASMPETTTFNRRREVTWGVDDTFSVENLTKLAQQPQLEILKALEELTVNKV